MSTWSSPAAIAVESRLFGALAVLRVIVVLNAIGLTIYRGPTLLHPVAMAACMAVMTSWTAFASWAYADPGRRTHLLLVTDLALALALLLATPLVKGAEFRASVPGSWIVAALLAWAIHYRWLGGAVAGLVLATADIAQRHHLHQSDYGNAFLLVLSGSIVGFLCGSLRQMATERDVAERAAAVAAERARLARAVHDGVLQVLAMVQRRGAEAGGDLAELGRLAGDQERELRRLIAEQEAVGIASGTIDLASELSKLEALGNVTVSVPGYPVEVPAGAGRELLAVARACLDNVRVHVGEQAPAWILLRAQRGTVELSVRDEGPGIPAGRAEAAAGEGRLGIRESIRGRIADLGGTADLSTGPHGTEWEFVVPYEAHLP